MEAKEFDFEFPRGDTCPVKFDVVDKDGNPIDLSEITEIYFTLKKNYTTPVSLLQKKYTTGGITVENSTGSLVLTHQDTALMSYGKYVYDIQIVSGDYVKTIVLGEITLTNESTHYANE